MVSCVCHIPTLLWIVGSMFIEAVSQIPVYLLGYYVVNEILMLSKSKVSINSVLHAA